MHNKVVLITGSTDGIGRQAALELAAHGFTVFVHGRSIFRARNVAEEIRTATGNKYVEFLAADLSSQRQVRELASEISKRCDALHVLINNAGVFMNERQVTEDGLELSFAVNHLAPFLLTNLLLGLLQKSAPARIITVSSMVHAQGKIDFSDLQSEKRFAGYDAYALSKLGNVLFTYELAERLQGTGVTVNCLHPGVIATKLLRAAFDSDGASRADGAATMIYLASSPEVEQATGKYYQENRETRSAASTYDTALRKKFWHISEQLTGISD
jgi:NAD(P)-dependent dehydrogenase (short-subunit alcohol dehydrogenase family)